MRYFLFDNRGVFRAEIEAAEQDRLPDNGTSVEPPEAQNGLVRHWNGRSWSLVSEPDLVPAFDLVAERRGALAALAQKRWEVETGGILFGGAIPIRTDEVGQAKITGALALMDKDPDMLSIDWEGQPGIWATIDKATLEAIGIAVGRHIQACFSRARVVSEAIQAATDEAGLKAAAAQIDHGWPE